MAATALVRRGTTGLGRRATLFGAEAATAVAMTVGATATPVTPTANALTFDATSTGPLLRLIAALGVDSIDIPNVPVLGTITINLDWNESDPVGLNDVMNSAAFGGFNPLTYTFTRPNLLASSGTGPLLVASGTGTVGAIQAYQAMLSSANGNTLPGYSPLVASGKVNISGQPCTTGLTCAQGTNVTNLPIALIRNPGTPNGGLYTRFGPILNLFGIDPVSPNATSGSSLGVRLNAAIVNVALGYDMLSDFPETLNPFSLLNSLYATVLPTYLLGGGQLKGATTDTIITNLVGLLTLGTTSTSYSTFVPNDLPLLEPLRLPSRLLNAAFDALGVPIHLGTPLADALQPALQILVNTGYTDVQTPSEGGTYNRTYDQSAQYVPFLSQATLTPQEWAAVPGDFIKALINGVKDVFVPGAAASVPTSAAASLKAAPTVSEASATPDAPAADEPATEDAAPVSTAKPSTPPTPAATPLGGKSAKPAKKPNAAAAGHDSGQKGSAHRGGVGGSKRAAS